MVQCLLTALSSLPACGWWWWELCRVDFFLQRSRRGEEGRGVIGTLILLSSASLSSRVAPTCPLAVHTCPRGLLVSSHFLNPLPPHPRPSSWPSLVSPGGSPSFSAPSPLRGLTCPSPYPSLEVTGCLSQHDTQSSHSLLCPSQPMFQPNPQVVILGK